MNNHTPGKWAVHWAMAQGGEAHHIVDDRDMDDLSVIATVLFHDDVEGETKANARLIAAAPDLLAALQDLMDFDKMHTFDQITARRAAIAAIAKATGEAK